MKIICIGNYPPRKCGIATFTENLVKSIIQAATDHSLNLEVEVIAMNDHHQQYDYPGIVKLTINDQEKEDYIRAANFISASGADLCLFQHEYGIYGGDSGLLILGLLKRIKIPVVSTFHTVLLNPSFHQKEVLIRIADYSEKIVIMNSMAIGFLNEVYGIPLSKIVKIEHGVPDFGRLSQAKVNRPKSWTSRTVLLTFGLIGRNKGIETVIKALPYIVKKHPGVLYVILGKTHPHVVKYAGEEYREYLEGLTHELGLDEHVEFLDQYVSEEELTNYLLASDIYITPYLNKAQITSGTLCYAMGGGSAVVSTPYWHAEELLAEGRGRLFDFKDYRALTGVLNDLLDNPADLETLKQRTYNYGLRFAWPKIGLKYISTFEGAIHDFNEIKGICKPFTINFPEINLTHLERLTNDTGLIQHANGIVADYKTGYCLDDNARALIACLIAFKRTDDERYYALIYKYFTLLYYLQNEDGSFKNYLTYRRNTTEEVGSDDAFGRAVWALGAMVRWSPCDSMFQVSLDLMHRATTHFEKLQYARGMANCVFGLYHYIKRFPDQERVIKMLSELSDKLVRLFHENSKEGWLWFEPSITYDNGLLPAALYAAFEITEKPEYLDVADQTRSFLENKCLANEQLTLVGNKTWWLSHHAESSNYAQQPIDAMAMVLLYDMAYQATKQIEYIEKLKICYSWFFGLNDLNLPLYDSQTHGCNDGLEEMGVNRNQGAESLIAYLYSNLLAGPYLKEPE